MEFIVVDEYAVWWGRCQPGSSTEMVAPGPIVCEHGAMAQAPPITPQHVRAAIDAARAVLRELEPDETPSNLRRVAASSARRLPPPLARTLVDELVGEDWLRAKVTAASDAWDLESSDRDLRASSLLVLQPEGWEEMFAEVVSDLTDREAAKELTALRRRLTTLESDLASARAKVKQAARALDQERSAAARRLAETRAAAGAQRRPDREVAEVRAALEASLAESNRLREDLRDADGRIDRLKADLLKARRSRAVSDQPDSRSWGGSDPLELARQLDALTAAVLPEAATLDRSLSQGELTRGGADHRFELPAGLAPDSPAAVDWLASRESATTLIVDGYNVTWLLDPGTFATPASRTELLRRLARLKRAAVGPMRILVVFDSQHGTVEPSHGDPVEVTFARSADDEVRRIAAETAGDVVVISTDREVREGSEGRGVLVLWSEALVGWRF